MFGEKAIELIRELDRSTELLPPYNDDVIRQVLEEMRSLFQQNQNSVLAIQAGQQNLFTSVQWRHAALERNKRCLLAYLNRRLVQLKRMRWEIGSVLPAHIKATLSENELNWFGSYSKNLATYMKSIGRHDGLDLTQNWQPPKQLFVDVLCMEDYGDYQTSHGACLLLRKNSMHSLPRVDCEPLVRQGILKQVDIL